MPPTRIYHAYRTVPFFTLIAISWANYELFRIGTGTHPLISPSLEKIRAMQREQQDVSKRVLESRLNDSQRQERRIEARTEAVESGWMVLNGVPIPSFGLLTRPFRRD